MVRVEATIGYLPVDKGEQDPWKRMGPGGPPGLQNRASGGFAVRGGFDSHTLPPACLARGVVLPIALAIHGGAWSIPDDAVEQHRQGLTAVLTTAWSALRAGTSALDTVELAVRLLEDDPTFNAGRGSHLNRAGEVEMDASIMEGTRLGAGAVAAVRGVRHPVSLARRVMEDSPHVMLVGDGARRFARETGTKLCRTRDLLVGRERERYERVRRGERALVDLEFGPGRWRARPMDTVGAVALDVHGHTAAATSTGGTQDKASGRVGDSAVIGAGTYADDRLGAASCTGWGESILRVVLAKTAVERLTGGRGAGVAARAGIAALRRIGGQGGLLLLDRTGRVAAAFNTARMARGFATEDRRPVVRVEPAVRRR